MNKNPKPGEFMNKEKGTVLEPMRELRQALERFHAEGEGYAMSILLASAIASFLGSFETEEFRNKDQNLALALEDWQETNRDEAEASGIRLATAVQIALAAQQRAETPPERRTFEPVCKHGRSIDLWCNDCARDLSALQASPAPLTLEFIEAHIGSDEGDREAVIELVREVERAHGIGGQP